MVMQTANKTCQWEVSSHSGHNREGNRVFRCKAAVAVLQLLNLIHYCNFLLQVEVRRGDGSDQIIWTMGVYGSVFVAPGCRGQRKKKKLIL